MNEPQPQPPKTEEGAKKGIQCARCDCAHFWVLWTRYHIGKIVRRRECRHCGHRITTTERITG
jgi:transcriptional regulator NrdR family protein